MPEGWSEETLGLPARDGSLAPSSRRSACRDSSNPTCLAVPVVAAFLGHSVGVINGETSGADLRIFQENYWG